MKPFIIFFLLIISCDTSILFDKEENTPRNNFELFWNTYNEHYAVFEDRNVDWDEIYSTYSPVVTDNTTTDELFSVFKQMRVHLDDPHVQLTNGKERFSSNSIYRNQIRATHFDWTVTRTYLDSYKIYLNDLAYGKIDNKIGYIYAAIFINNLNDIADKIVDEFSDLDVIIIDLRHNDGGDFYNNGFPFFARFLDKKRFILETIAKIGPNKNDFGEPAKFYVSPQGNKQFTKKIILLTDRYSVSAAEATAYAFSTLPYVTIMGDTTAGGAGDIVGKDLPNGWGFSVTVNKLRTADGSSYEGKGVFPDIPTQSYILGKDLVLEEAIQYIKTNL